MMVAGELTGVPYYYHLRDNNLVDRSTRRPRTTIPTSRRCFPIRSPKACAYFRKTGIFPINHGMVIRREVAEKHPWTVLNLLKAYDKANEIANSQRMEHVQYHVWAGLISRTPARRCANRRCATASMPTARRSRPRPHIRSSRD